MASIARDRDSARIDSREFAGLAFLALRSTIVSLVFVNEYYRIGSSLPGVRQGVFRA